MDKNVYTTTINYDIVCCTWLPPPPLPRDFLADSEKHELFLTVRLSRGQNPTNLEKVENYYKLWLFLWYLITLAPPPPSPRDFLTGPDKHELSLTVRFSHDKNIYTTTINYDFVCFAWLPSPPSMRFSRWPWERWTLLDGEIISWSKSNQPWKLENYYKLWLFLSYLITLATNPPPPPMRFSHWPWQSWTVLDSEIFSWQKYFHKYHKLWLCLLCLITLTGSVP